MMKRTQAWRSSSFINAPNLFAGVVCLVVFVALGIHLWDQHRFVRSDDALIQGHYTTLSARIKGRVSEVFVDDHDPVKKGQLLARIDRRDYATEVLKSLHAQQISIVEAQLARIDLTRAEFLKRKKIVSQATLDHALTAYQKDQSKLAGDEATLEQSLINEAYTEIRAPEEGIIAIQSANPGMEVKDGDALFAIVYPSEKWVEAKIKETDLNDLHLGESVEVSIDALPGRDFSGTLKSMSPTTEGLTAAIVPDNAAGNYTKYVQRVPVKIALKLKAEDQEAVRIGLSANIKIRRKI